jgi:hypothetical protein
VARSLRFEGFGIEGELRGANEGRSAADQVMDRQCTRAKPKLGVSIASPTDRQLQAVANLGEPWGESGGDACWRLLALPLPLAAAPPPDDARCCSSFAL